MENQIKRTILNHRLALLRGHVDSVEGQPSPGFARELRRVENELRQVGVDVEPQEERSQGS
jgi:hypothetical protein